MPQTSVVISYWCRIIQTKNKPMSHSLRWILLVALALFPAQVWPDSAIATLGPNEHKFGLFDSFKRTYKATITISPNAYSVNNNKIWFGNGNRMTVVSSITGSEPQNAWMDFYLYDHNGNGIRDDQVLKSGNTTGSSQVADRTHYFPTEPSQSMPASWEEAAVQFKFDQSNPQSFGEYFVVSLNYDGSAPDFDIQATGGLISGAWTKGPLTLNMANFTDLGSGIKEYAYKVVPAGQPESAYPWNTTTSPPTPPGGGSGSGWGYLSFTAQGQVTVYFRLTDNVNNFQTKSFNVNIDTTAPSVSSPLATLTYASEKVSGLDLSWVGSDGQSGIDHYSYAFSETVASGPGISVGTANSVGIAGLTRGKTYSLLVIATDKAGNTASANSTILFPALPPTIDSLEYQPTVNVNGMPEYKVDVSLSSADLSAFTGTSLKRSVSGMNDVTISNPVWNSGKFRDVITDKSLALKAPTYRFYVNHTLGGSELAGTFVGASLPNYVPPFKLELKSSSGTVLALYDSKDPQPLWRDPSGNSLSSNLWLNNSNLSIKVNTADMEKPDTNQDIEDHVIKYRIGTGTGSWVLPKEENREINVSDLFKTNGLIVDGDRSMTVSVGEFLSTTANNPITEAEKTLERATNAITLTLDTTAPTGSLSLSGLTGEGATKLRDVTLGLSAQDSSGTANSGLSSIVLWNASAGTSTDSTSLAASEPSDAAAKTSIALNPIPTSREWALSEVEGTKLVVMKITDKAGNSAYTYATTVLDMTPPRTPEGLAHVPTEYSGSVSSVSVNWTANTNDFQNYELTYTGAVSGTIVTNATNATTYAIPITGASANAGIFVSLTAVDAAGNRSVAATATVYTPASLGSLSEAVQSYDSTSEKHSILWTVSGGAASAHVVEILDDNNFVLQTLNPQGLASQIIFDTITKINLDNTVSETNLAPHAAYRYRLVAINSGADATLGPLQKIRVSNKAPTAPAGLSPTPTIGSSTAYASGSTRLSWMGASDPDGDGLTNKVFLKKASDANYTAYTPDPLSPTSLPLPSGLENEAVYEWYVQADDNYFHPEDTANPHLTSDSAVSSFTYDAVAPSLSVTNAPQAIFTSQSNLHVIASDNLSGIKKINYKLTFISDTEPKVVQTGTLMLDGTQADLNLPKGHYSVTLTAEDGAGNESVAENLELRVDRTAPTVSAFGLSLAQSNGRYLAVDGVIPLSLTAADDFSGISHLRYGWSASASTAPPNWSELSLVQTQLLSGSPGETVFAKSLTADLADGSVSYLIIQVVDWAGNTSASTASPLAILSDSSAPSADLKVTGLGSSLGQSFASSLSGLSVSLSAEDPHSGVTKKYALRQGSAEPVWYDSWQAVLDNTAVSASVQDLVILAKAVNGTGLETIKESVPFVFDNTPSEALALSGFTPGDLVWGQALRLSAQAADAESGVASYSLAFGSTPGAQDVSALIDGNSGGWLTAAAAAPTFSFRFPEVSDGRYYFTLKARNRAGLETVSSGTANGVSVTNLQEKLYVTDQGPYSSSQTTFAGQWRYAGVQAVDHYEYRLTGTGLIDPAWAATAATSVTLTGLSLSDGGLYVLEARAAYSAGGYSETASSLGLRIDTTAPEMTPGAFTVPEAAPSAKLAVSFTVSDGQSGLSAVGVRLQKPDGSLIDVPLDPSAAGAFVVLSADESGAALGLISGQSYILTLRAVNGAGLATESSPALVFIDDTPPPAPQVLDQGDVINTAQFPQAHWLWSEADPESGTVGYEWTLSRSTSAPVGAVWQTDGGSHSAASSTALLTPVHGETWYFIVKATNKAGLSSYGHSNGIVFDADGPFISKVKILSAGGDPSTPEVNYIASTTNLRAYVEAQENLSDIRSYTVAFGRWDGLLNWIRLENATDYALNVPAEAVGFQPVISLSNPEPLLQNGLVNIARGIASNAAGLISEYGYSTGVMLDTGKPLVTLVNGLASPTAILFNWEATPSFSPIVSYKASLRPVGSLDPVWETSTANRWTVVNLEQPPTQIPDGSYELVVTATNAAGTISEVTQAAKSPVIRLDHSPPEIPFLSVPAYASSAIALSVTASDPQSGLNEYQYAVGTFENAQAFTGGWLSVLYSGERLDRQIVFQDLASSFAGVQDGAKVYIRVRVRNGVGLWSNVFTSSPVVIDKTAPTAPVVSRDGVEGSGDYTVHSFRIAGLGLATSDPQSLVTAYRMALVTGTDSASLATANWRTVSLTPGSDHQLVGLVLDNLSLQHGASYYVAVQSLNGAGDWSQAGFSKVVRADLSAPSLAFPDPAATLVVNGIPKNLTYTLTEDVSADVTISFFVAASNGAVFSYPPVTRTPGTHDFTFDLDNKTAWGTYTVSAELTDKAGNSITSANLGILKSVRYNAPAVIAMAPFTTNPNKPLVLTANVFDPDGDLPLSYSWNFGDGSPSSSETLATHAYQHTAAGNAISTYTVTLTVTDAQGQSSSAQSLVTVENTHEGALYTDEIWSGTQIVTGDLIVPAGLTLTVKPGTVVKVRKNQSDPNGTAIRIQGTLIVEKATGAEASEAVFQSEDGVIGAWEGILVDGNATLINTVIRHAQRGLGVLPGAQAELTNSIFESNIWGLHVLGNTTSVSVTDSTFRQNTVYGIKEDQQGRPRVKNGHFKDNLYDYYAYDLSVISTDQLNRITGNSGNGE